MWSTHLYYIAFLLTLFTIAQSQSIIKTLPGFPGTLPFKLETGYVGVRESGDVQLFYYFIESERDPSKDPLVFWLTGGPGCSGFSSVVYGIGPLNFDFPAFNGSLPSLIVNPYSWTKVANFLFVDLPAVSGFSYSTTSEGYEFSDTILAKDAYDFLRKWLIDHPDFIKNPLYIGGISYSGMSVALVAVEILNGNEDGHVPRMLLKGYLLGNPLTDYLITLNSRVPYAHRIGLISDEYYETAKNSCDGNYFNPDPKNAVCTRYLQLIEECIANVNYEHILEPGCLPAEPNTPQTKSGPQYVEDFSIDTLLLSRKQEAWCRSHDYQLSNFWANDPSVQDALHVRYGTVTEWKRCHRGVPFERNVKSVVEHHHLLSKKGFRALLFSGDHDMVIPYLDSLMWVRNLNLTIEDQWRPWFVNGFMAGYTEKYKNLTFATVMGAGHTAPEYKPKQCFAMVERWLSDSPL